MMQYDVKAAYAASDAAMVAYPTRIKGAYVSVTTGGTNPVIFYDFIVTYTKSVYHENIFLFSKFEW